MSKNTQPAPTPWGFEYCEDRPGPIDITSEGDGWVVCTVGDNPEGETFEQDVIIANKIVRAVNAYGDLLEALKAMVDHASEQYPHFESERGQKDIAEARAAIAKATGKEG